jgi:hypothetical protein
LNMLDLAEFVSRLKQVVVWTKNLTKDFKFQVDYQNGNYGTVFRQLNPVIDGQPLFTIEAGYTTWNKDVYELEFLKKALQQAFKQRDAQLIEGVFEPSEFQCLGRIVYFETQVTTHDGTAAVHSDCFVDESDVPPIDTWFYFDAEKRNLFCWIPREFEEVMQKAIDVEMFGSYHWLDKEAPRMCANIVAAMITY